MKLATASMPIVPLFSFLGGYGACRPSVVNAGKPPANELIIEELAQQVLNEPSEKNTSQLPSRPTLTVPPEPIMGSTSTEKPNLYVEMNLRSLFTVMGDHSAKLK